MQLNAHIPEGPVAEKWDRHRFELKLVNPANKRKYNIIVVGTGLAGLDRPDGKGRQAGQGNLQNLCRNNGEDGRAGNNKAFWPVSIKIRTESARES